jgi:hypothetical protein
MDPRNFLIVKVDMVFLSVERCSLFDYSLMVTDPRSQVKSYSTISDDKLSHVPVHYFWSLDIKKGVPIDSLLRPIDLSLQSVEVFSPGVVVFNKLTIR